MKKIKINFADFWNHLDKTDNYFYNLVSKEYDLEISDQPDLLIYSGYGYEHLKYNCLKLFYNGENERINWNACDFAIGMDLIKNNARYYRLPNWVLYDNPEKLLIEKRDSEEILRGKTKFCNMVVSNGNAKKRIEFFKKLSSYKKVDSGGRFMNNVGGPVKNKLNFIKDYKFTIAFENSSYPGYTTEKLFEPMLVNSIPIYWGNPKVNLDFNTKSFINYFDYRNEDELIEKIIELDKNDDLYVKLMSEHWFNENQLPEYLKEDSILRFFEGIIKSMDTLIPVSQTYRKRIYSIQRFQKSAIHKLREAGLWKKHFR